MPGRVVIFGWSESVHIQRWVAGLSDRGWQIRLISLGGSQLPQSETICLPRRGRLSYLTQRPNAVELARQFEPDLVHVHYAGGFGWWGLKCDFAPLLVSAWGSDITGVETNPLRRMWLRRLFRKCTGISVTSQFLREAASALAVDRIDKIEVIPFGVNVPESVTPLPPTPIRLCFIKRHRPIYGPDILLRALAILRRELPEIRLTLAGEGEMTPRLRAMCAELGLEANVDFVGFVPNDRIYSLLSEHHMMVMPSLSESFGVAVLEAAACGRPTIASRVGGVPEVLRDGETGLLVPPGDPRVLADAILRLARDPETCQRMGQAGRKLAAEYSWSASLDRMNDLYERLIHGQ